MSRAHVEEGGMLVGNDMAIFSVHQGEDVGVLGGPRHRCQKRVHLVAGPHLFEELAQTLRANPATVVGRHVLFRGNQPRLAIPHELDDGPVGNHGGLTALPLLLGKLGQPHSLPRGIHLGDRKTIRQDTTRLGVDQQTIPLA